jgi:hypothetical protein
VVTIILTAGDNGVGDGHSFRLQTYADGSHPIEPGDPPVVIQFTAHTAGEFTYFCSRFCGGGHGSMHGTFTVLAPQPLAVEGVSPSTGPTSGGTTVTITGMGFVSGSTVKFGTQPATSVELVNSTTLRAVTPPGPFDFSTTRMVDVIVTNPNGDEDERSFTWTVPAPSITSISPASGAKTGATLVTIRGGGFSTAVPVTLTFGGVAATDVTVVDAVTLTARTPAHAAGKVDVAITTSKGSTTSAAGFRFGSSRRRSVRP